MIRNSSASFTRPADTTTYTAGDLVANSTTAGSVTPLQFNVGDLQHKSGVIGYARIFKDHQTITNANFNLHLFSQSPTVSNGDNGALAVTTAQYYLGVIAIDMTSGAFVTSTDSIRRVQILFGSSPAVITFDISKLRGQMVLYGLLEAAAAYAPQSGEAFDVTLELGGNNGREH